jgi:hypothetical protein
MRLQPPASGLINSVAHKVHIGCTVSVGGNGRRNPHVLCHFAVTARQIQTIRVGIELQDAAPLFRRLHNLLQIDVVRAAFVDKPARRMCEDIEVAIVHGPDNAFGHFSPGKIAVVMDGTDGQIQLLENVVRQVEGPVLQDVDFDGL